MRTTTIAAAAILSGFLAVDASAQQPRFEVASVKRNGSSDPSASPQFQGTRFVASNMPLSSLISAAYGVPSRDLFEAPQWIFYSPFTGGERYDVVARMPEGSSPQDQQAMLRNLLEDRFALRLRRETRQLPVYTLTKLDERTLGPNLRPAAKTCDPRPMCEGRVGGGFASYKGAPWASVVTIIGNAAGEQRIIDRTGLSGFFDYEITYSTRALSATTPDIGVDIFTAVRQQLGLKLEPGRAPFEIVVVESVARPTPD